MTPMSAETKDPGAAENASFEEPKGKKEVMNTNRPGGTEQQDIMELSTVREDGAPGLRGGMRKICCLTRHRRSESDRLKGQCVRIGREC